MRIDRPPPSYAVNYAARPTLREVLHRLRWADIEATPPTVLDIGDGSTMDVYSVVASLGFRESREEVDALIADMLKKDEP